MALSEGTRLGSYDILSALGAGGMGEVYLVSRVRNSVTNFPERGTRLARRDDRAYREYVKEEQRRQTGCPARKISANFGLGTLGSQPPTRHFQRGTLSRTTFRHSPKINSFS